VVVKVMTFDEAIEFFRDKTVMTAAEYEALVAEVGEYAASMAFSVSRIASADLLQDLHGEVLKAIEEGETFWDFREGIDGTMERLGWQGMAPYRLDNIFRTNIQGAYNVGRHKQMKAIADRRPYWEYDAVNDTHTRPSHLAHDGKIYRHDHPFWHTWYPPNGYR
jgi:SPP1 gp7 family putative phage head morphogenesis protein